ncbi:ankyrin repeat-containing protein At5g02620-like [Telopea speciosissima]|uniref:ankyrin repeat-containing protein At5g02620-like n=1 Tax=Telopea speciosissima TaxID=54955 RepID=UPI001CC6073D|nr:ankyrin repeat-containing protein At5g02620-like [Telopea speciosissima]
MDPKLYSAAKFGDITFLRQVVNEDSNRLLSVTPQENTTLHVSVRFGHTNFVKEVYTALLQSNPSLEGITDYSRSLSLLTLVNSVGDTALHVAARAGYASIAEFLIEKILPWPSHHHDVENGNSSDPGNRTREVAREKIRMRNKSKNTALHEAVRRNDLVMVKLLIRADPELGHPNYDADAEGGESPLYLAARDGRLDIINQIFHICPFAAHGGPRGRTALHVAVVDGKIDVVRTLIKKKGEVVNKVDENGRTALHYAASKTWGHKIVQQLLRPNDTSSAYQLDKDGLSPLHIAALKSRITVFQELIQWCPDSGELLDKKRRNVLHFAVMSKDFKKIRFAIQQVELEDYLNQPDDEGNTPFHLAATQSSLHLMELFISNRRIDVRATNNKGQTATDIFALIASEAKITSGWCRFMTFNLRYRFAIRGEEKWTIEGVNEEQIHTDPNKQGEVPLVAAAAAKSETIGRTGKVLGQTLQIVASLIATVTFAAVLQVPGGYNSSNGSPILLNNPHFQKFIVHNARAMTLSVFSLILMLGAPAIGNKFYSFLLIWASLLIYQALNEASDAFQEGFTAVLPPTNSFSEASGAIVSFSRYILSLNSYILFLVALFLFVLNHSFNKFRNHYFSIVKRKK